MTLQGIIAAVPTPFDASGEVARSAVAPIAEQLRADGVAGFFVCGSTGQGASLAVHEREEVAAAYVEAAKDVPVIVQVGADCARDGAELARHAQAIGADAIAAVPPAYFATADADAVLGFLKEIQAGAPDLPFYCYYIPGRMTASVKPTELLSRSAGQGVKLAGVKFTSADLAEFRACVALEGGRYDCLFGRDEMMLAGLAMGAHGAIGSTYNVAAPLYRRLWSAFEDGDLETARQCQDYSISFIDVMKRHGGLPALHAMMRLVGLPVGPCRLPWKDLAPQMEDRLKKDLEAIGFYQWARSEAPAKP
jgi:N-acetylneuraminate lyase